jgi:hypothetical protein
VGVPITVAARSNAWSCSHLLLGSCVRIRPRAWMSVSCECCVLSRRGLCIRLITCLEESYRVWSAWVWSWSLVNGEFLAHEGLLGHGQKIYSFWNINYGMTLKLRNLNLLTHVQKQWQLNFELHRNITGMFVHLCNMAILPFKLATKLSKLLGCGAVC